MRRKNATDVKLESQAEKIGLKSEEVFISIVFVSGIKVEEGLRMIIMQES